MTGMETNRTRQFKVAVISGGFVIILTLILMMLGESGLRDWERFQENYLAILGEKVSVDDKIRIRQIENHDLRFVDRCPTCHVGLHDNQMTDQSLPLTAHPGEAFSTHDPEQYGCSTCHGGRGRALDIPHAHDQAIDNPFLRSNQTQAYCGKCHLTIFPAEFSLPGAGRLAEGRTVFLRNGCQGCHRVRGVGGMHGPELTDLGTRTLHSFDFRRVSGDRSINNWHREHLRNPQDISTESIMPAFHFPETITSALTLFLRGQFSPQFPLQYITLPMIREFKHERSVISPDEIFSRLCSGCHGQRGLPDSIQTVPFSVPTLANPDFQAVASLDYIAFTITEGRGGRYMHAWTSEVSGLYETEIRALLSSVRDMRSAAFDISRIKHQAGSVEEGARIFQGNCAMCHEANEGTRLAPNILSDGFLSLATNAYILANVVEGRANTAMPAWRTFREEQLIHLLAYLRSKQTNSMRPLPVTPMNGNISRGDSLFYYSCSRCHGEKGTGGIGPAIMNGAFLRMTDPGLVAATITSGRAHSAMFGLTSRGIKDISGRENDILDIITFMYSRRDSIPDYIPAGMVLGDPDRGKSLFYRRCAECHGQQGEGGKGPALNNQEFLSAASNGYLLATISLGRLGTRMPSWGRGSADYPALTPQERQDVVALIRQWQTIRIKRDKRWIK